jgi:hypothetical protein
MLLTIPVVSKNSSATISLNKADLFSLAQVSADSYFSVQANVQYALVVYDSQVGNQKKLLRFNLSQALPEASFFVSDRGREVFLLERIVLEDFDGGTISIERTQLPSGLDITVSS